jgi:F0F1-type ATP synthase membrane subunit b/b'
VHPYIDGGIALVFVIAILLLIRWVWRALRALFRGAEQTIAS